MTCVDSHLSTLSLYQPALYATSTLAGSRPASCA